MSTKGQITLFIILGLALLIGVGIYLVAQQPPELSLAAEQDLAKTNQFIQGCLANVGEEAIRQVALQGGYADVRSLPTTPPQQARVIAFEPLTIPLWHEVHACADNEVGCLGDNRPHLCEGRSCPIQINGGNEQVSFQTSIEQLTEENLDNCLLGFAALEPLSITAREDPQVHVTIHNEDVLFELDYPITITTSDNQEIESDEYTASLNVNLPRIYEFAMLIYEAERNQAFLEEQFLNLIAVYGGIDNPIPPMRDAQFKGSQRFWVTRNVQQTIEQDLLPLFGFTQVVNAMDSYVPISPPGIDDANAPYAAGVYDYMSIKLGDTPYPLATQFEYPYTGMDLDISGKEFLKGRKLPGTSWLSIVGGLTFIEYKFKYSASFPIVVTVSDPRAFDGNGLDLSFGLEANVKNNYPLNTSGEFLTFYAADETLDLASPEQLVNHEYIITVKDRHTQAPIPDVGITYACGGEYQMGATDEQGIWRGKLPYCLAGGSLIAEETEYASTGISLSNSEEDGASSNVEILLWPRVEKTIKLYVRSEFKPQRTLTPNETVILTISRQSDTPFDAPVPLAGILEFGTRGTNQEKTNTKELFDKALANGEITREDYDLVMADLRAQEEETITLQVADLVPGTYDLTGFLTYYGLVRIPEDERCDSLHLECTTLPEQNFTTWNSGGVVLTEEDGVAFTEEFIYSERNLTLYVIEQPIPTSWKEMEKVQPLEDYQTYERKRLVQPEFG